MYSTNNVLRVLQSGCCDGQYGVEILYWRKQKQNETRVGSKIWLWTTVMNVSCVMLVLFLIIVRPSQAFFRISHSIHHHAQTLKRVFLLAGEHAIHCMSRWKKWGLMEWPTACLSRRITPLIDASKFKICIEKYNNTNVQVWCPTLCYLAAALLEFLNISFDFCTVERQTRARRQQQLFLPGRRRGDPDPKNLNN